LATVFELITDEFRDDCSAIRSLVVTFNDPNHSPKARIAAANSATLLVAATFEEYIRELARQYAKAVVSNAGTFGALPPKLASIAWKRTMDGLGKIKFDSDPSSNNAGNAFGAAQTRFAVIYEFCKGDLSQDVYRDLIHNENNMRPNELNGLFKVSGLKDICAKSSDKQPLLDYFGETEAGKAHGKFLGGLEDFFERRNTIAHALNSGQSSGPAQIIADLDMLEAFAAALTVTLNALTPSPQRVLAQTSP
jgi:hypothetical protein